METKRQSDKKKGKAVAKQAKSDLQHLSKKREDATVEWQEDVNDRFEELMADRKENIPDMSELLKDAGEIEKVLETDPQKHNYSSSNDTNELETEIGKLLVETETTPTQSKKPHFSESKPAAPRKFTKSEIEYQESFTSQQETAELRDELSSLSSRLTNLETTIEGIIAERKNLPGHLERLSADINRQFTIMNDRLNTTIESGIVSESVKQAAEHLADMSSSSTGVLEAVRSDLTVPPKKLSQIAQTKPITGKKKRVCLIN